MLITTTVQHTSMSTLLMSVRFCFVIIAGNTFALVILFSAAKFFTKGIHVKA